MKTIFFSVLILLVLFGCKKSIDTSNCTDAIVTLKAHSCKGVGVIIGNDTFPCDDLPDQYAVEGKKICILFGFWDDPATCSCCGGTKVTIISVH